MKIHLPNSAFLGNIDAFLRKIDFSEPDRLEVTFNKDWMSLHPLVISMTAALAIAMKEKHQEVRAEKVTATSGHYLKVIGLTELINAETIAIEGHEPSGRYIRISVIKNSGELTTFITNMIPLLHASASQAEPIEYIMSELIRNVLEHANSPVGAVVCAQYFKKSNRVSIGVADLGLGIKKTINHSYAARTDAEAILLALRPGITGTTKKPGGTAQNAGAGLFFIKSIAKINRDFFVLYSGNSMYKLLKDAPGKKVHLRMDPKEDRHSLKEDLPYWQGTAVGIDITIDANGSVGDFLSYLRKIFHSEVKEKKKEYYKKPRFV